MSTSKKNTAKAKKTTVTKVAKVVAPVAKSIKAIAPAAKPAKKVKPAASAPRAITTEVISARAFTLWDQAGRPQGRAISGSRRKTSSSRRRRHSPLELNSLNKKRRGENSSRRFRFQNFYGSDSGFNVATRTASNSSHRA
jgi:hypothetical protein